MPEQFDARGKPRSQFQTPHDPEDLCVKSDAEETDINTILRRAGMTGIWEQMDLTEDHFPDVTEIGDFADVMRTAKLAEMEFLKLPPEVRKVFKNDVANWLDTAHDPEKRASLIAEGKLPPEQQPTQSDPQPSGTRDAPPGDPDPTDE